MKFVPRALGSLGYNTAPRIAFRPPLSTRLFVWRFCPTIPRSRTIIACETPILNRDRENIFQIRGSTVSSTRDWAGPSLNYAKRSYAYHAFPFARILACSDFRRCKMKLHLVRFGVRSRRKEWRTAAVFRGRIREPSRWNDES